MSVAELIAAARETNTELDAIDEKEGFATPREVSASLHARTIMSALEAALATSDWGIVAQAYVMTEQLADRFTEAEDRIAKEQA